MQVSEDVLKVLDRAVFDGAGLTITEKLERPMYIAVNKVLEAAGGKWNRKAKAHLFDGDARDAIEPIILTGAVTDARKEFDQFFTPDSVADIMFNLLQIQPGDLVLEPSAGEGRLAKRAQLGGAAVAVIEVDPKLAAKLDDWKSPPFHSVMEGDFLSVTTVPVDVVIMNPPFSKRQDIHHVLHALKFLRFGTKGGGRLVAVMSAGVLFREDKLTREFRAVIDELGGRFEPLPDGAFKESGTMVRTCLCIVGC